MIAARSQWRWPIALAVATVFGLLAALISEGGVWWILCWIALASPLLTIAWCLVRSRRGA